MEIDAKTKVCGLIGYPVGHSVSPLIHNNLAEIYGQNLAYVPLPVAPGRLGDAVKGADAFGFLGMNVTVPYKSEVIPYLKEIDPIAKRTGAVNTLLRVDGGYKGYNTDMPGLSRAMRADGVFVEGEEVLLLGAGGVARAAAFLLLEEGAGSVTILNRSPGRAQALADELNRAAKEMALAADREGVLTVAPENMTEMSEKTLPHSAFARALPLSGYRELDASKKYIVIQATGVGMYPESGRAAIEDEAFYRMVKIGYDIIFNPLNTRFMQLVKASGGRAFHGLKMLLYQGIIAYELWNGVKVSEEAARDIYRKMKAALGLSEEEDLPVSSPGKKDNIILIGFMGSGKTTTGIKLSYKMRRTLLDTDKLIERQEGRSIADIFAAEGEAYFREQETGLLKKLLADTSHKIISVGGGTPLKAENRKLLRELGKVVYLKVSPETVYQRIQGDRTRPLLQGGEPMNKIRSLLAEREKLYEEAADIVITGDKKEPDEVLKEILEGYR